MNFSFILLESILYFIGFVILIHPCFPGIKSVYCSFNSLLDLAILWSGLLNLARWLVCNLFLFVHSLFIFCNQVMLTL